MIKQIASKEGCRTNQGRHHENDMNPRAILAYGSPSANNQASAYPVEGSVNGRQIKNVHSAEAESAECELRNGTDIRKTYNLNFVERIDDRLTDRAE